MDGVNLARFLSHFFSYFSASVSFPHTPTISRDALNYIQPGKTNKWGEQKAA